MSSEVTVLRDDQEEKLPEYINMTLPTGEVVRFNRVWSGYRFTDREVEMLQENREIRITTKDTDGIIGSLDWQEFNGYEFLGFAPWDATAYTIENAPFPLHWNGHTFTTEEQAYLRRGNRLLLVCRARETGFLYPVHVSFGLRQEEGYPERWGILPHFEEFDQPSSDFTKETCRFLPIFYGKRLTITEIEQLRKGGSILFVGEDIQGEPYPCHLTLVRNAAMDRWQLRPEFSTQDVAP